MVDEPVRDTEAHEPAVYAFICQQLCHSAPEPTGQYMIFHGEEQTCLTCSLENGLTRMRDLPSLATGTLVKIAGSVIRYQTPPTRNGKRVVYVIMEDGMGIADVTVFSDVQEKCGHVLFRSGWLGVQGKIQRRGATSLSIIAQNLYPLPISSGMHT